MKKRKLSRMYNNCIVIFGLDWGDEVIIKDKKGKVHDIFKLIKSSTEKK